MTAVPISTPDASTNLRPTFPLNAESPVTSSNAPGPSARAGAPEPNVAEATVIVRLPSSSSVPPSIVRSVVAGIAPLPENARMPLAITVGPVYAMAAANSTVFSGVSPVTITPPSVRPAAARSGEVVNGLANMATNGWLDLFPFETRVTAFVPSCAEDTSAHSTVLRDRRNLPLLSPKLPTVQPSR